MANQVKPRYWPIRSLGPVIVAAVYGGLIGMWAESGSHQARGFFNAWAGAFEAGLPASVLFLIAAIRKQSRPAVIALISVGAACGGWILGARF
jgi:hypothetical protein